MKVYIIIPAYNEETMISKVIADIKQTISLSNIIVIDDGSQDQTAKIAKQAGAQVLRHIINRGQGAALMTGTDYALRQGAEIIVHFDADDQHQPLDIINLIKPIAEGKAEAVLGSRFLKSKVKNSSQKFIENYILLSRRIVLKLALMHQWFFSGLKVTDSHCGLRAFSRVAAQKIKITQDRMAHASEILDQIARHKLKFVEAPVNIKYTAYSLQKGQKSLAGSLRIVYDFLMGRILNSNLKSQISKPQLKT